MARNALFLADGFPRSGNTFLRWLIKGALNDPPYMHHYHNIAALKAAKRAGIPCFVLLRDPLDCIASLLLLHRTLSSKFRWMFAQFHRNEQLMAGVYLNRYTRYYEYVRKNYDINDINIVRTKVLFENPSSVLDRIATRTRLDRHSDRNKDAADAIVAEYNSMKAEQARGRPLSAGIGNEDKENQKKRIKGAMRQYDELRTAEGLYNELIERG